jgi:hypothetical protein
VIREREIRKSCKAHIFFLFSDPFEVSDTCLRVLIKKSQINESLKNLIVPRRSPHKNLTAHDRTNTHSGKPDWSTLIPRRTGLSLNHHTPLDAKPLSRHDRRRISEVLASLSNSGSRSAGSRWPCTPAPRTSGTSDPIGSAWTRTGTSSSARYLP